MADDSENVSIDPYTEYDVLHRGDYIELLVVSADNGPHPTYENDPREWASISLDTDQARELALQLQEAARLAKEGEALDAK